VVLDFVQTKDKMQRFVLGLLAVSGVAVASPRKADVATLVTRQTVQEAYDYVIVGGGTAGLTVADRLTADGKTTVLVVEVGQLSTPTFLFFFFFSFRFGFCSFCVSVLSCSRRHLVFCYGLYCLVAGGADKFEQATRHPSRRSAAASAA
jgi:hypothetical protein